MSLFESMGLRAEILNAIQELGFERPTPIQEKTIPFLLENDQDMVALAQTGNRENCRVWFADYTANRSCLKSTTSFDFEPNKRVGTSDCKRSE